VFEICHEVAIQQHGHIVYRQSTAGLHLHALEQLYLHYVDS
jgi:hypothetical protein